MGPIACGDSLCQAYIPDYGLAWFGDTYVYYDKLHQANKSYEAILFGTGRKAVIVRNNSPSISPGSSYLYEGAYLSTPIERFSSSATANPLSISSSAAPAPEPATWGLILLGFGLAGSALRHRRTGVVFA